MPESDGVPSAAAAAPAAAESSSNEPLVLMLGSSAIELRATAVVVDGDVLELTPRERDVFAVLARRPGSVVTKGQLLAEVWRGSADGHAVEVTVGRLRRRLGPTVPIRTVPRRGYRLEM